MIRSYEWPEHLLLVEVKLCSNQLSYSFLLDGVTQEEFVQYLLNKYCSNSLFSISNVVSLTNETFEVLENHFRDRGFLLEEGVI